MTKLIKVESCLACLTKSSFNHLKQAGCPLLDVDVKEKVSWMESGKIHLKCPLEDYDKLKEKISDLENDLTIAYEKL